MKYVYGWHASRQFGISECKLRALRHRGLIPEAVQLGRIWVYPETKLEDIRRRLVDAGHIGAESRREVAYVAG